MPATLFDFGAFVFWPAAVAGKLLETQARQWQAAFAWQQAMADMHGDLFDRWSCQFADAARIDD